MNGWQTIQMWAKAIAPCAAPQIAGFSLTVGHLADLAACAGAETCLVGRIRSGTPAEVSLHLLSLQETEVAERLGGLVNERLKVRLADEAMRLDRLCRGSEHSPLGRLIPHRRRIVFDLAERIFKDLEIPSESERAVRSEDRALLVANEAVPYAAQYLSVLDADPDLPEEERRRLILKLREEISQNVPAERVSETLLALDSYLGALGLCRNSK